MYARFGQELYTRETIAAATVIAGLYDQPDGRPLKARIAEVLPHNSAATRDRLATKLLQRILAGAPPCTASRADHIPTNSTAYMNGHAHEHSNGIAAIADRNASNLAVDNAVRPSASLASFARLLSHLPDTEARRDLVYYSAARADALIGAIARDILYPYFIEGCIPAPYGEDEFIIANAGLLLAPEPTITTGFVADYARRVWNFDSERTVSLALRILRQAGILLSAPLLGERGRVAAYTLAPHGLSLAAFLWGLYDEYHGEALAPTWDQVGRAQFAKLFVVPSSVVASRLFEAERAGLATFWSAGGTRRVALKVREASALARLLLSNPGAK